MPKIRISRREAERGLLPRVCALTGQETDDVKRKTFMWNPPWVIITILAGLLPYIIVALVTRKTMEVEVPLVRAKHGHWLWRQLFAVFGLIGSVVLVIAGGVMTGQRDTETLGGALLIGGLVLFVLTLILLIVINYTTIRPLEITDRSITLTGVHQNFIDALQEDRDRDEEEYQRKNEEWRARQREKGRDRDEDEYDDRRPPRAKRPANRDDDYDRDRD